MSSTSKYHLYILIEDGNHLSNLLTTSSPADSLPSSPLSKHPLCLYYLNAQRTSPTYIHLFHFRTSAYMRCSLRLTWSLSTLVTTDSTCLTERRTQYTPYSAGSLFSYSLSLRSVPSLSKQALQADDHHSCGLLMKWTLALEHVIIQLLSIEDLIISSRIHILIGTVQTKYSKRCSRVADPPSCSLVDTIIGWRHCLSIRPLGISRQLHMRLPWV